MSDLISRQAAIEALHKKRIETMEKGQDVNHIWECLDVVAQLPSAQPEPLTVNIDHELTKDECDRLKHAMRDAPILLLPSAQPTQINAPNADQRTQRVEIVGLHQQTGGVRCIEKTGKRTIQLIRRIYPLSCGALGRRNRNKEVADRRAEEIGVDIM